MAASVVFTTWKCRAICNGDAGNLYGRLGIGVLVWRYPQVDPPHPNVCEIRTVRGCLGFVFPTIVEWTESDISWEFRDVVAP